MTDQPAAAPIPVDEPGAEPPSEPPEAASDATEHGHRRRIRSHWRDPHRAAARRRRGDSAAPR